MSIIINEGKNEIRRYLLGQLEEADEERLELRLLTEPSFVEEFDTIVDEITDQYVSDELDGEERKRVEEHFLKSPERQQKADFARELLERAAAERGRVRTVVVDEPGFWERVRAFWKMQSSLMRTATTIAMLVIVAGVGVLVVRQILNAPAPGTYASITLNISTSDRATGSESKTAKLEPDIAGIKIELALPDTAAQTSNYRVELIDDQERSRNVPIAERTPNSLVLRIPADEITRGDYIIRLYADEQRIRGSYYFTVE